MHQQDGEQPTRLRTTQASNARDPELAAAVSCCRIASVLKPHEQKVLPSTDRGPPEGLPTGGPP
jgi:hypothetical protein